MELEQFYLKQMKKELNHASVLDSNLKLYKYFPFCSASDNYLLGDCIAWLGYTKITDLEGNKVVDWL